MNLGPLLGQVDLGPLPTSTLINITGTGNLDMPMFSMTGAGNMTPHPDVTFDISVFQYLLEALVTTDGDARVSQLIIEMMSLVGNAERDARVSQLVIENTIDIPNAGRDARVSQLIIEVAMKNPVALQLFCGDPPNGTVAVPYTHTFPHGGGTPPYTISIVFGALPPGLVMDSQGNVTGTPTEAGTFTFTVQIVDSGGNPPVQVTCSITILGPPTPPEIQCGSPPVGTVGAPYSHQVLLSGGTPPLIVTLISGSLPTGLSVSTGGLISGTPTAAGSFTFTLRVTDALSLTDDVTCTILIGAAPVPTINCASPPNGLTGVPYTHQILIGGGVPPLTVTLIGGALPTGLTISSSGLISGTPTVAGVFPFILRVTDNIGQIASVTCSITIVATPGENCPTGDEGGPG